MSDSGPANKARRNMLAAALAAGATAPAMARLISTNSSGPIMAGSLLPQPKQLFQDANWNPLIGGKIYTYAAGTLTPKTTYQDVAMTIANTNPTLVNARGEALMFGDGLYRIILKSASGDVIYDVDDVESTLSSLADAAGSALIGWRQSGADSIKREVADKLRERVTVRDCGALGNGINNDSPSSNKCLAAHDIVIFTPGIYRLDDDLVLKSNQQMIVEAGAKLICNGSRITSYRQNNISIRVDGEISSVAMTPAPGREGWPSDVEPGNPTNITRQRGFIEFGGLSTSIASGFRVFGRGKIYGDWVGTPSLDGLWTGNLNLKGIAAWFANDVKIADVEVYGFRGEAVYYYNNSAAPTKNVLFDRIYSHDSNFNGLNFNCGSVVANARIRDCIVERVLQGVELSVGQMMGCTIRNCQSFPVQLGGGTVLDVDISKNYLYGNDIQATNIINAAGNPLAVTGVVSIAENYIFNAPQNGIYADALLSVRVLRNTINGYSQKVAASTQGFGIDITTSVLNAIISDNTITSPDVSFGGMVRNRAAMHLNSNNMSQDVANNRYLKIQQESPQTATADEHEYYVFNGIGAGPRRFTRHYANGRPEQIVGSDEFVRVHAEATPASGGTTGRYVIATFKAAPGATPDDSLVIDSAGAVYPAVHNARNLGTSSNMWANLWCVDGVINRSDARLKTVVEPFNENEINAAKALSREIGKFKWLSAIEGKGPDARIHIGMTVQRCIEIMGLHSLNAFDYGFICYDEWEQDPTHMEPGSAYGFRTAELLSFIARGFEARLAALEERD